ncbi:TPA: hypothetical protein ACH3X1_007102 [Trebouxia sp. C0004]
MSTPATEVIDFIQQFVEQQEGYQGACVSLSGEKGYYSVESGARHHFVIGLIIDLDGKAVQMEITKGHHIQALAPMDQYVLDWVPPQTLGFEKGRGQSFAQEHLLHETA